MPPFPFQRIIVVGTTSSGKSTLAEKLATRLDMAFIELDALHWEPDWKEAPLEIFRARVVEATKIDRWVAAGNYHAVRDLLWPQADAIVWLDYSLPRILWQLTRRTFSRWWTRELLWGTNREPMWVHLRLWSRDSLYNWLFRTYWRRKREFPELLQMQAHRHLHLVRFTNPAETEGWLKNLEPVSRSTQDPRNSKPSQPHHEPR